MKSLFDPSRSGVYLAAGERDALRAEARLAGLTWFDVDVGPVAGKREFLAACAKALRLPRTFGGNWDALADCLKDLCADSVINLRNCAPFAEAAPDDCATGLEILHDASMYWRERGSTFVTLVDAAPAGVTLQRFRLR